MNDDMITLSNVNRNKLVPLFGFIWQSGMPVLSACPQVTSYSAYRTYPMNDVIFLSTSFFTDLSLLQTSGLSY